MITGEVTYLAELEIFRKIEKYHKWHKIVKISGMLHYIFLKFTNKLAASIPMKIEYISHKKKPFPGRTKT